MWWYTRWFALLAGLVVGGLVGLAVYWGSQLTGAALYALCGTVANNDPLMPCVNGSTQTRQNTARSRHSGGVNTAFGDGSIRFMSNSTSAVVWQAMGSMDNGEVVSNQ